MAHWRKITQNNLLKIMKLSNFGEILTETSLFRVPEKPQVFTRNSPQLLKKRTKQNN